MSSFLGEFERCCAADAECWRQMERFGNEATADGALEAAALLHATHLSGAAPRVVLPPDCLAAIESRLLEGRVSPTLFADAAGAILSRMLDAIPILHDPDGSHEALSAEHAEEPQPAAADGVVSPGVREHDGVAATVDVARRRARLATVARSWLSEARRSLDEQEREGAPPLAEPRAWRSASGAVFPWWQVPLSDDDDSEDGVDTATGSAPAPCSSSPDAPPRTPLVSSRRSPALDVPLEEAAMARGTVAGTELRNAHERGATLGATLLEGLLATLAVGGTCEHASTRVTPATRALAAAVVADGEIEDGADATSEALAAAALAAAECREAALGSQSGRSLLARSGMPLDPGSNGTAEAPTFAQRHVLAVAEAPPPSPQNASEQVNAPAMPFDALQLDLSLKFYGASVLDALAVQAQRRADGADSLLRRQFHHDEHQRGALQYQKLAFDVRGAHGDDKGRPKPLMKQRWGSGGGGGGGSPEAAEASVFEGAMHQMMVGSPVDSARVAGLGGGVSSCSSEPPPLLDSSSPLPSGRLREGRRPSFAREAIDSGRRATARSSERRSSNLAV